MGFKQIAFTNEDAKNVILYSLFNMGQSLSMMFVMTILVPKQLRAMVGEHKAALVLGIIVAVASIMSSLSGIVSGILADRLKNKHIWMIIVANVFWGLSIIVRNAFVGEKVVLIVFYGVVTCLGKGFYGWIDSPFNAMIPILFEKEHYGTISGAVGFSLLIGTAIGVTFLGLLYATLNPWVICVFVGILINLLSFSLLPLNAPLTMKRRRMESQVEEEKISEENREKAELENEDDQPIGTKPRKKKKWHPLLLFIFQFIKPFTNKNFFLIILVRLFMYMSLATTQTFTLYFLEDMFPKGYKILSWNGLQTAEQALGVFFFVVLLTSLFSTVLFGYLSDHYSEKRYYIFISAMVGGMLQILIVLTRDYNIMLICGLIAGFSIGAFLSIDLALANEVLPNLNESGKDLAIYAGAKTLPILLATPIGGWLLHAGNELHRKHSKVIKVEYFGYYLIFILSAIFALISGFCVLWIRENNKRIIKATLVIDSEPEKERFDNDEPKEDIVVDTSSEEQNLFHLE